MAIVCYFLQAQLVNIDQGKVANPNFNVGKIINFEAELFFLGNGASKCIFVIRPVANLIKPLRS